jgi:protein-disulfide isomerase
MPLIEESYIATGKVRYIFRPLYAEGDRTGRLAAESLYCAGEQGKFWEMHDWLYFNEASWVTATDLISTLGTEAAPQVGLDGAKLTDCLSLERYFGRVQAFRQDAAQRGLTATPVFLINGRLLGGAQPFEQFQTVIEEELAK